MIPLTRENEIEKVVTDYLRGTGDNWGTYATNVVMHYLANVPTKKRTFNFYTGGDTTADQKANTQLIKRLFDGSVRMPIEIEESLVEALPEQWNRKAKQVLAQRFGLLAARIPDPDHKTDVQNISELMRQTADVLEAMAPILADGKIDSSDAPLAKKVLQEINDVDEVLATLRKQITDILPDSHNVHVLHKGA